MVQVNRVCLNIIFINRPQFLVDSNELGYIIKAAHSSRSWNVPYEVVYKKPVLQNWGGDNALTINDLYKPHKSNVSWTIC